MENEDIPFECAPFICRLPSLLTIYRHFPRFNQWFLKNAGLHGGAVLEAVLWVTRGKVGVSQQEQDYRAVSTKNECRCMETAVLLFVSFWCLAQEEQICILRLCCFGCSFYLHPLIFCGDFQYVRERYYHRLHQDRPPTHSCIAGSGSTLDQDVVPSKKANQILFVSILSVRHQ